MEATDGEPKPVHPKEQILFAKIDIILAEEAELAEHRRVDHILSIGGFALEEVVKDPSNLL